MRLSVTSASARLIGRGAGAAAGLALLALLPAPVLAHTLEERYEAPLPLVAYVLGAAFAVAMSFVFVILRRAPAVATDGESETVADESVVPAWLRRLLQALGLIGWLWIMAQALVGGSGDGDVASLFVWVYGWVGVALLCALVGPVWAWIDPFSTIHQLLSAVAGRLGLAGEPAAYPERLGRWPAVVGFAVVVWIELVGRIEGGRQLGLVLLAYSVLSVAGMAYFGRRAWRENGEIFSVWFGLLGRLAPRYLVAEPEDGRIARRPFASGLLTTRWTLAELVLVALGTGSIIFDGLSQTQIYFDAFIAHSTLGPNAVVRDSITGLVFLGIVVLLVLGVARLLGVRAVAAGLLPVAVGYLVAHYLTFLLVDGQRILAALNDPLLRGDNLLPGDLGFWEPANPLPVSIVWSIQLAAVVGGHIIGAWAGHAALAREEGSRMTVLEQLPLAALMVLLTSVTLWSLGQAVIVNPA